MKRTETPPGDASLEVPTDSLAGPPTQLSGACYMYARVLERFWYVICLLVVMTVVAFGSLSFLLYERPDFSDPAKGFIPRGTVISSRLASLFNFLNDTDHQLTSTGLPGLTGGLDVPTDELGARGSEEPPVLEITNASIQFCYSISHWEDLLLALVFEDVNGGNVLTPAALKSVCRAEERLVTSHPLYRSTCLCRANFTDRDCPSAWSAGNHVALLADKSSCEEVDEVDVARAIEDMVLCAPHVHNVTRAELESAPDSVPAACRQHGYAVHTLLYYLLPAEFSRRILAEEAPLESPVVATLLPLSGGETDVLQAIYLESIKQQPREDGTTRLVAVDAFIKYRLFSDLLLSDSLIVAAASGLIFFLIWLYTGSISITLAAVVNMVFTLVLAYFFFVVVFARPFFPFGNIVAMVLVVGIGADDTFIYVDLWRSSRAEAGRHPDLAGLVCRTLQHAAATMAVTSFTTAAALFASVFSDVIVVRCFAIFAGVAVLMNLVLTLTLTPAVVVMQHKLSPSYGTLRLTEKAPRWLVHVYAALRKPYKVFNETIVVFLVTKLKHVWIVAFLLLLVANLVVVLGYPGFRVSTRANTQFFVASDYLERFDFEYSERFSYKKQAESLELDGCIVWGTRALDNGHHWDPDGFGRLVLDDGFRLSHPDEQAWMLDFCQDLRRQAFFRAANRSRGCFMEDFVSLMRQEVCVHPLTGEDATPCCNQPDFPYEPVLLRTCLAKFAARGLFPDLFFRRGTTDLAAIKLVFPTNFPKTYAHDSNEESWTTVNGWTESRLASAPASLSQAWYLPDGTEIIFYDLQESLKSGTLTSMLISLGTSSAVLCLSIGNPLLALWATLSLTGAVVATVASLVLLGWQLDVIEATIITLSVGLSVDFTIHYGVAYRLAPTSDRRQRARYSLVAMTPAVTMAALSTFLAGSVALQSVVLIFYHFGIFLMLVMAISWLHGTLFFQSLCMVLGPQGTCGDITGRCCCQ